MIIYLFSAGGGRKLEKQQMLEVAEEAVKIYFDYNVSAEEAVRRAKETILIEKEETMGKAN